MMTATLDEASGALVSDLLVIGPSLAYGRFQEALLAQANLIYGAGETAKYAMKRPIELFGVPFRACLVFHDGALAALVLYRIAEPGGMQEEFDALGAILGPRLTGQEGSDRALQRAWRYGWGEVALVGQPQDASVFVSVSWANLPRAPGGALPLGR